jgi:hypothetical protein
MNWLRLEKRRFREGGSGRGSLLSFVLGSVRVRKGVGILLGRQFGYHDLQNSSLQCSGHPYCIKY